MPCSITWCSLKKKKGQSSTKHFHPCIGFMLCKLCPGQACGHTWIFTIFYLDWFVVKMYEMYDVTKDTSNNSLLIKSEKRYGFYSKKKLWKKLKSWRYSYIHKSTCQILLIKPLQVLFFSTFKKTNHSPASKSSTESLSSTIILWCLHVVDHLNYIWKKGGCYHQGFAADKVDIQCSTIIISS